MGAAGACASSGWAAAGSARSCAGTGAPRDRIAARLKVLEEAGVVTRVQYQERPQRFEYHLTDSGKALVPVLKALLRGAASTPSTRRPGPPPAPTRDAEARTEDADATTTPGASPAAAPSPGTTR